MTKILGLSTAPRHESAKVGAYDSVMPVTRLRSSSWSSDNPCQAVFYMLCWYTFSTSATLINKSLIKEHGMSAELLTVCHLVMGTIFDAAIFSVPARSKYKMWFLQPMKPSTLVHLVPLSVLAISSKLLTYWSYSKVPVALTHTCKASTPLFNVVLAYLVYRTTHATPICLSLAPIVVGVAMASMSEVQINEFAMVGLVCAVSSSLFGVMQSMYAKYLLRHGVVADSVNLHFYNGLLCIVVNSPVILFGNAAPMVPGQVPYTLIIVCSICQFISSLSSMLLLGKVSELTYSIMSTLKRVVIVVSAIVYFGNSMTGVSAVGMSLALGGVGAYQYAKLRQSKAVAHLDKHAL
ncbi:hypothetical protein, variant [Aphanomyces invadans]|uniref:Sugar phosphate transporter domain-containing protein n=1 Tax=Aphanomyces invadans TaxID=157072 RepID=A0A024UJ73_9STRA|nr:hypothetical protein, variant [Aphanomyces invadans]ETW06344.1 hypothetical protein, variant [Aphanomyces invadans]|eukprot:XP_008864419.1 hypothetical protein, variant [Aphanomyces invadans]